MRWRSSVIAAYSIFPGHSQAAAFQLMLYLFRSDPTHFAEPKPSPRCSAQIRSSMSSCMPRWAMAAFTNMSSCGTALRSKRRVTHRKFLRFMARQDELNTLASIKGVPSAARLQSVSDQIPFGCIGFYIISRPQLPQSQGHTLQLPFADLVQELNPHCRFRFVSLQAAIQRYLPENRTLGECCFWLKESTLSTNRNFEFWMIEFILLKIVHRSMNH